ncbi:DUF2927 domain-containing protein [Thalassospiraceae bacterium LMO-JJ14]|nr:DUF2927 domain-containing protein [Thalassospiraceae bacterium LMO-JJ14]
MPLHAFADTLNPIPSVKDIRRFAEDVVISSKPGTRLVKWTHAPTVRLETKVAGPRDASTGRAVPVPAQTHEIYYAALRSHIQDLAELTGMPIRLMPRDIGVGGDIVITIVPRMQMSGLSFPGVSKQTLSQIMGPSRCFFIIWPTREWAVSKARIVINSILDDDHIKHCLLEELTQSLGLPNDSDRLRPSIFNETAMLQKLSDLDRILIRTVYDPRINPGMDLGAFRDKAETVIGSYMAVPE